jgi:2Fe-2S ferredoxin
MTTLTFVSAQGLRTPCAAMVGSSVMLVALANGIDGLLGDCGGALACGTCHVYVEPSHLPRLAPPGEAEHAMLDMTASERRFNSRLGCQIRLTEGCDGLVVHLPETQV